VQTRAHIDHPRRLGDYASGGFRRVRALPQTQRHLPLPGRHARRRHPRPATARPGVSRSPTRARPPRAPRAARLALARGRPAERRKRPAMSSRPILARPRAVSSAGQSACLTSRRSRVRAAHRPLAAIPAGEPYPALSPGAAPVQRTGYGNDLDTSVPRHASVAARVDGAVWARSGHGRHPGSPGAARLTSRWGQDEPVRAERSELRSSPLDAGGRRS
jgi:hypothetical protein